MDRENKRWRSIFALAAVTSASVALAAPHVLMAPSLLIGAASALAIGLLHHVWLRGIPRIALMARAVGTGERRGRVADERRGRVADERRGEIERLARERDAMQDQIEAVRRAHEAHVAALEQLCHADRIATLGLLASSVAHELGTPLNVVENHARLIAASDAATLSQAPQSAAVIVEQTQRMTRIVREILSFARTQSAKFARVDLGVVVRKALALAQYTATKHRTHVIFDAPESAIEIDGDADKLLQVIVNIAINGMQAMPHGGTLRVSLSRVRRAPTGDADGAPRSYACIEVIDTGVGIDASILSKVFEPFFSTRGREGGTGLGLFVAQGIAREHGGWITVASELGHGARFGVYLPVRVGEASHAS